MRDLIALAVIWTIALGAMLLNAPEPHGYSAEQVQHERELLADWAGENDMAGVVHFNEETLVEWIPAD